MTDLRIEFRPGVNSDIDYIKSTWLHSYRNGEGVKDVPNSVYYDYENRALVHIIPRCSNTGGVVVAHEALPESASFADRVDAPILGYIVAEPLEGALLVHFCYVRGYKRAGKKIGAEYRQRGIATALLAEIQRRLRAESQPVLYTYRTEACWKYFGFRQKLKELGITYMPYLKYTLLPSGWETGKLDVAPR